MLMINIVHQIFHIKHGNNTSYPDFSNRYFDEFGDELGRRFLASQLTF